METTATGIKRVSFFTASPVHTCDRCGQGIKYVCRVSYKDGTAEEFGLDCINKILDGDTSLKTLFRKNQKLLVKLTGYANVLRLPVEQMPQGREYFNSGFCTIADMDGEDICFGHYLFHPIVKDMAKNQSGKNYVISNPAERTEKCIKEIEKMRAEIDAKIATIESFLARVLAKAGAGIQS